MYPIAWRGDRSSTPVSARSAELLEVLKLPVPGPSVSLVAVCECKPNTGKLTFDAHPRSSLIVALDFDSLSSAMKFAQKVSDLVGMFKIGSQLFTSAGPEAVKQIATLGNGIFLDLKFHDIPNTVAGAVLSSAAMPGVQLVNVHALGGSAMLKAAAQTVSAGVPMGADRTRLIAVTILTSMDHKAMRESGIGGTPLTRALKLAQLTKKCGVDGVVASVQEAKASAKRAAGIF